MAYSMNPITVERFEPILRPLVTSSEVTWRTKPGRARWLAYKVREALHVASLYEDRFPELARLDVRVQVLSAERVRAVAREREEINVDDTVVESSVSRPRTAAETGSQSVEDVIARWELRSPLEDRVYFPEANLDPDSLKRLWLWAEGTDVLIFDSAGALTLLPRSGNEDAAEYAWTPEEIPND